VGSDALGSILMEDEELDRNWTMASGCRIVWEKSEMTTQGDDEEGEEGEWPVPRRLYVLDATEMQILDRDSHFVVHIV